MKQTNTSRPLLLRCHRLLGWLLIIPTLYMFITGIANALADQIERIIEPALFSVHPLPEAALPLSTIEQEVQSQLKDQLFHVIPRAGVFDTWQVTYHNPEARIMWLNPYTAAVIADRAMATRPTAIIRALHTGEFFGWPTMAPVFAASFICIALMGLWYSQAYKHGKRFWHIQLSLVSLPVTLFLAVSGELLYFQPIPWLSAVHTGEHIAVKLLLIICLLIGIFSLCLSPFSGSDNKKKS